MVEAHLAVQAAIRSYQVTERDGKGRVLFYFFFVFKVRGHLAASIDPLGLNNMDREQARKMIIRSVTVDEKVGLFVFHLSVSQSQYYDSFCSSGIHSRGKKF